MIKPNSKNGIFSIIKMVLVSSVLPIDKYGIVYHAQEFKYRVNKESISRMIVLYAYANMNVAIKEIL